MTLYQMQFAIFFYLKIWRHSTICLWNTNTPVNGQFQWWPRSEYKYFDTSRKIFPQEMTICHIEALIFIFQKLWLISILFLKIGQYQDQMVRSNRKILRLSQGIFRWIIKAPSRTIQILLTRLKFIKIGQTPRSRSRSHGKKCWYP